MNGHCWLFRYQCSLFLTTVCLGGYEKLEDTQYFGATFFQSADTVQECESACNNDGTDCVGFGFNTNNNQCWIHTQVGKKPSGRNTTHNPCFLV